jgi:hypothetical protein
MTDIEGSARLWEHRRDAMVVALAAHDALLRSAVEEAGGAVFKTTGDGLLAAFDHAESAVTAAIAGQRALDGHDWPETGRLRVRMALHSGSAEVRDNDFFGPTLNRVARLLAIGHGDQVLVSGATAALVAGGLPLGCELVDLVMSENDLASDSLPSLSAASSELTRLLVTRIRRGSPESSLLPVALMQIASSFVETKQQSIVTSVDMSGSMPSVLKVPRSLITLTLRKAT